MSDLDAPLPQHVETNRPFFDTGERELLVRYRKPIVVTLLIAGDVAAATTAGAVGS